MTSNPMVNFFQNLRLPLQRKEEGVFEHLSNHFSKFKKEFKMLLENQGKDTTFDQQIYDELSKQHDHILGCYQSILDCLDYHNNGKLLQAHQIFETKMTEMQNNIMSSKMRGTGILHHFYRIRIGKGDKREDLFHISLKEREKVKAYRYSIAGFPCLYLAGSKGRDTGLVLAWLECGKPDKFYWSEFKLADDAQDIEVLDLTESPFSSATQSQNFYTWALNKEKFVPSLVVQNITTYPLLAACSLVVANKDVSFIPEYIIPQMLLLWVHNNDKFKGIKYFSCSHAEEARKYNAFNIALPPKVFSDDSYCLQLMSEFKTTNPYFVDISDIASINDKAISIMLSSSKVEEAEFKFINE